MSRKKPFLPMRILARGIIGCPPFHETVGDPEGSKGGTGIKLAGGGNSAEQMKSSS
jgi:hypothetical protein